MTEKAFMATIYVLLRAKSASHAEDGISELLSDAIATWPESGLIDWGYACTNNQWLLPAEVPGVCLENYQAGASKLTQRETDVDALHKMNPSHIHKSHNIIYFDWDYVSTSRFVFGDQSDDDAWTFHYGFTVSVAVDKRTCKAEDCYGSIKVNLPSGLKDYDSGWTDKVEMPANEFNRCMIDARAFATQLRSKTSLDVFVDSCGNFYVQANVHKTERENDG